MIQVDNAWIGWKDTRYISDIETISEYEPELLYSFKYALISCIDSLHSLHLNLPSISKIVLSKEENISIREIKNGLLTSGEGIIKLATTHRLFNGFDEVWFFSQEPSEGPPSGSYILSDKWIEDPAYRYNEESVGLLDLLQWMYKSEAVLGLADGTGMSYVTTERSIAERIEAFPLDSVMDPTLL